MAACTDTEEKPSSPKDTFPLKICSENAAVNHEMRKNCYNEFNNFSKNHEILSEQIAEKTTNPDVNTLSEDEFLQLMIEASTFNKSSKQESALLKKLRIDNPITDTEPSDKTKLRHNPHFSVHRNSRNSAANNFSSLSYGVSHVRTSDSRKKHFRNKDDSSTKSVLNSKGIHQSQSLQDLISSDLCKTRQKSNKAHRTHSLSSDEVAGLDADSITVLKKLGKKSNRNSSYNSKSDMNKTSYNKYNSKSHNSGSVSITIDVDEDSDSRNLLPYQSSMSDSEIPTSNYRKDQSFEDRVSVSSPIEIEMEEIKFDKTSGNQDCLSGKELEKNGHTQNSSKFYVDCNDIDARLTFPLKLLSSIDDQTEAKNEQVKHFPGVFRQDFFKLDHFGTKYNDTKQLINTDINGNPFSKNSRQNNLASFVSSTLMDYNNGSLVSETKNRKNKRLRNSVNKGVLSENIAGHRGEEDIDTLLQYINSSDKKGKASVKGNCQNQIISKNSLLHENERKKSFGKEVKNCHKSMMNTVKKKLTRSNSLENLRSSSNMSNNSSDIFIFEHRASTADSILKNSAMHLNNSAERSLDINSNEEKFLAMSKKSKDSSTDDSSLHNSVDQSSPEVSSFAADFYSTANVSSQTHEESGFSIVKKKQRKKLQGKRSDSYRWRNTQAQRKKGMMLPLAESKCGKQDSRRKSTSSVPHSEHSSADNSDLDSVHSLPVRGSVPHPTQPHPHTTPSSSSSTPQASYADIARMPISKLTSPPNSIIPYSTQANTKPQSIELEVKKSEIDTPAGKHQVSGSKEPLPKESTTFVPVEENESDDSSISVNFGSHTKETREINTQTEPENTVINKDTSKFEPGICEELSKTLCSSCSTQKNSSCPKPHSCTRPKVKSVDIPPVIMDNMPSESNACNVSFGFGIEEVLLMTPTMNCSQTLDLVQKDNQDTSSVKKGVEVLDNHESSVEKSSVNTKTPNINAGSSFKSSVTIVPRTILSRDLPEKPSSHLRTVCYGTGRNICYNETKVNVKRFNLSELTNFLGNEFHSVQKEIGISKQNKAASSVIYYADSSEDS